MNKTLIRSILLISLAWLISGCSTSNVSAGPDRATNALTRQIETVLKNSKELKGSNIYAASVPTGVLLTGTVITERQKYLASTIANSLVKKGTVTNRTTIIKLQIQKSVKIKK
jgi:osmotically-inducible protein OsmY